MSRALRSATRHLSSLHRLAAALAASLSLSGCANGELSLLGSTLTDWAPHDGATHQQAEALAYASLALDTGDRRGLVVLGAVAGPATYWPTGNDGLLVLHHDGLQATAGLPQDLLETRYSPLTSNVAASRDFVPWLAVSPGPFRVVRRWETDEGMPRQMMASGRLNCGETRRRDLPLGARRLQPCEMALEWEDGRQTAATLWRDAKTHRLWAVDDTPWPGGPRIRWEVARAWW